jgi:hypothetical protein
VRGFALRSHSSGTDRHGARYSAALNADLDALVDLQAQLQVNGGTPSHLIVDPLGWAELRKLKTATDSNESLTRAGLTDSVPMLLSLPVLVSRECPHTPRRVRARVRQTCRTRRAQ